jgi:hypothetical protein
MFAREGDCVSKCFCLLAVGVALALSAHGDAVISVQPQTSSIPEGNTLSVNVGVSGASDLYAFQFDITFSPTVLHAATVSEGNFLPSGGPTFFIAGTIDNSVGTIANTADTLEGSVNGVSGNGFLADFGFVGYALGSSQISLSNITLLNSQLISIPFTTRTANVTVSSGVQTVPEPNSIGLLTLSGLLLIAHFFNGSRIENVNRP